MFGILSKKNVYLIITIVDTFIGSALICLIEYDLGNNGSFQSSFPVHSEGNLSFGWTKRKASLWE